MKQIILFIIFAIFSQPIFAEQHKFSNKKIILQDYKLSDGNSQSRNCECSSSISYPDFTSLSQEARNKIKKKLKKFASRFIVKDKDYCEGNSVDYDVTQISSDVAVVNFRKSTFCGAYPNTFTYSLWFDSNGNYLNNDIIPLANWNKIKQVFIKQEGEEGLKDVVFDNNLSEHLDYSAETGKVYLFIGNEFLPHVSGEITCDIPNDLVNSEFYKKLKTRE
ncbi:MAG: hypothetical protein WCJ33_00680 [Pseudomonadota bacterium]